MDSCVRIKSRVIFSIATAVDLIMLDELLTAGDIAFQRKAARRLEEMIGRTKSVVPGSNLYASLHENRSPMDHPKLARRLGTDGLTNAAAFLPPV